MCTDVEILIVQQSNLIGFSAIGCILKTWTGGLRFPNGEKTQRFPQYGRSSVLTNFFAQPRPIALHSPDRAQPRSFRNWVRFDTGLRRGWVMGVGGWSANWVRFDKSKNRPEFMALPDWVRFDTGLRRGWVLGFGDWSGKLGSFRQIPKQS
jgi:hypothetical protein